MPRSLSSSKRAWLIERYLPPVLIPDQPLWFAALVSYIIYYIYIICSCSIGAEKRATLANICPQQKGRANFITDHWFTVFVPSEHKKYLFTLLLQKCFCCCLNTLSVAIVNWFCQSKRECQNKFRSKANWKMQKSEKFFDDKNRVKVFGD